jgi:REP element-mobilizing transposase RayT
MPFGEFHYRVYDNTRPYFITLTVVDWIDVFVRKNHKIAIVEALEYCQKNKGLEIYARCLMPSHLHMIVQAKEGFELTNIIRDFKTHTSKIIIKQIKEEPESRREWMLESFKKAAGKHPKVDHYKFWKDGYHPVELYSAKFTFQKLNYIHYNPVEEMLVDDPCEYMFSSARNYAEMNSMLEVVLIM